MESPQFFTHATPVSLWPVQDRDAWLRALEPGDVFDTHISIAAQWSDAYRRTIEWSYGCWLNWLQQFERLDRNSPPGARVHSNAVRSFIDHLQTGLAPASVAMISSRLKRMMDVIEPEHDWSWLGTIYRNLKRAAAPTREKHTRVVNAGALYQLGKDLFSEAERQPRSDAHSLIKARNGLMISLLAARPIRLANFCAIELGVHLTREGELFRLAFSPSETKVGRPIDFYCPQDLTPNLEKYVEAYRPLLVKRRREQTDTRRLWIDVYGRPIGSGGIYVQIRKTTMEAFGHPINPHLFRDCAATSVAVHDPEHVRIATVILGHSRTSTTDRHYNQAQMLSASRTYSGQIVSLRNGAREWRSRRRGEDT